MKFTIEMNVHELSRSIAAGTLESLVNDIKSHEDQVRSEKAAQTKPAPVAAPAPEAPIAVEPTPTPTPAPSEPEITEVQLRAKFVELNKKGKKKELKALLETLGVAKVSDIQPDQYEDAWAGLEAL